MSIFQIKYCAFDDVIDSDVHAIIYQKEGYFTYKLFLCVLLLEVTAIKYIPTFLCPCARAHTII